MSGFMNRRLNIFTNFPFDTYGPPPPHPPQGEEDADEKEIVATPHTIENRNQKGAVKPFSSIVAPSATTELKR